MFEKELKTKKDFFALKSGDVLRISSDYCKLYKTTCVSLNEFCYKVSFDLKCCHENDDILIVDSVINDDYVKTTSSGFLIIKVINEKVKIKKEKVITLIDTNMKKHFYVASHLAENSVCSFFLQTGEI